MATNAPDLNADPTAGIWQPPSMTGEEFTALFQWNPVTGEYEIRPGKTLPPGATGFDPKTGVIAYQHSATPATTTTPTPVTTTPTTNTNTGGGGGGGGTGGGVSDYTRPWGGVFTAPTLGPGVPETPQFHFTAPTYEDALKEPGYQFAAGEGRRLMEQGAAAKGVLNTGGTLRDVDAWGTNFAATKYNDVYGRAYQKAQDEFAPKMTAYSTTAAANQRSNEWNYSNAWNKYLFDYQAFRNWQNDAFDKYFRTATA